MNTAKRFWMSWYQPTDDYRPLSDPPHPQVIGWWKSGENDLGDAILCALVEANTPDEAKIYIQISWPEATVWRFCEEKDAAWRPGDRFPFNKPWMIKRLNFAPEPEKGNPV